MYSIQRLLATFSVLSVHHWSGARSTTEAAFEWLPLANVTLMAEPPQTHTWFVYSHSSPPRQQVTMPSSCWLLPDLMYTPVTQRGLPDTKGLWENATKRATSRLTQSSGYSCTFFSVDLDIKSICLNPRGQSVQRVTFLWDGTLGVLLLILGHDRARVIATGKENVW